jgi:ABC-type glutathione transport system ATPase component
VVNDVSLEVTPDEVLSIVGPSGGAADTGAPRLIF